MSEPTEAQWLEGNYPGAQEEAEYCYGHQIAIMIDGGLFPDTVFCEGPCLGENDLPF